jgi:hypothetical protein
MKNMRLLFAILLSGIGYVSLAQDEFPDMRSKKDLFKKMQEKDIRSDISSFSMAGIDEGVGKQPLRNLQMINSSSEHISFEGNGIQVKITAGIFDASKHKLTYYTNSDNNKKYLTKIDNKPFFGDYGKMPVTTIDKVIVLLGSDTVAIPREAYADLYNPIFTYEENGVEKYINNVYLSADGRKIYIYMLKRESGGSYEVTWVIHDKKYLRRVVDYGFLP